MEIIKNIDIVHRIINESQYKHICICGCSEVGKSFEKVLNALKINVSFFIDLSEYISNKGNNDNLVDINDLTLDELKDVFCVDIHKGKEAKVYNQLLKNIGMCEWENFVHIFSPCISNQCVVKPTSNIDINLGVMWEQDINGMTIFGCNDSSLYTIVTIGGSTTYADQLVYAKCWSEIMYEMLSEKGYNIRVICAGAPSMDSSQELIQFLRDIVPMKPDMVISYDGANDVVDSHGDFNDYGKGYPFAFPRLAIKIKEMMNCSNEQLPLYLGRRSEESEETVWIRNKKIMNFVCNLYGIKYYSILQPMLYRNDVEIDAELDSRLKKYKKIQRFESLFKKANSFCNTINEIMREERYYRDFSDLLDEKSDVYTDFVHLNEEGNTVIAEKMVEMIEGELYYAREVDTI